MKHSRFYWLSANLDEIEGRPLVVVTRNGQEIDVEKSDLKRLTVRLCDEMLDLDQPVEITWQGEKLASQTPKRTIATLAKTLQERGERQGMFSAEIEIPMNSQN